MTISPEKTRLASLRPALAVLAISAVLAGPMAIRAQDEVEQLDTYHVETMRISATIPATGRIGGLAVDTTGYVYIANQDNQIWRVDPHGNAALFADGFYASAGIWVNRDGSLVVSDYRASAIYHLDREGNKTLITDTGLSGPVGIVGTGDGTLYTVNCNGGDISKISPEGEVSQLATHPAFSCPNGLTLDNQGQLWAVSLGNSTIIKIDPQTGETEELVELPGATNAHVVFAQGSLFVTQIFTHVIFRVEMDGSFEVISGKGLEGYADGPKGVSTVSFPNGIYARGDTLYFNTLRGKMIFAEEGSIQVRTMMLPSARNILVGAFDRGGLTKMIAAYQVLKARQDGDMAAVIGGVYGAINHLMLREEGAAGLALMDRALADDNNRARSSALAGRLHANFGDKTKAIAFLEEALALNPKNHRAEQDLRGVREFRND